MGEGEKLEHLVNASQALTGLLRPDDGLLLLTFDDRLTTPAGLSRGRAAVRAALTSARASGMTSLWDALFGALALGFSPVGERSLVLLFTYEPTGVRQDDGWHTVELRLKGGRGRVQTRPGYYAR